MTDRLQIHRLLLAFELEQEFSEHLLDLAAFDAGRNRLYHDGSRAEELDFEAVVSQLVGDLGKYRLLPWGQLDDHGHQQLLHRNRLGFALLEHSLKEHALVGYVLVDDPETFLVYGENERVPHLTERPERGELRSDALLWLSFLLEHLSAASDRHRSALFGRRCWRALGCCADC